MGISVFYIILACLFLVSMIYFFVTTVTFEFKKMGYDQANMWIFTSLFLFIVSALNFLHSLFFVRYLYHLRSHKMTESQSLGTSKDYYMHGA